MLGDVIGSILIVVWVFVVVLAMMMLSACTVAAGNPSCLVQCHYQGVQ